METFEIISQVEKSYQQYLQTTFFIKDPVFRKSFEEELRNWHLSKGPYLEATPVFQKGLTPEVLFFELLGTQPQEAFTRAMWGDRPLYKHQEEAIRKVFGGKNILVSTSTGSGKTETFLYPILLHLYREYLAGSLCPGTRAMILYPMNALANDQCERLGEICSRLEKEQSPFRFTFGQFTGETPENPGDSYRKGKDKEANRLCGELVFRDEMRRTPPNILLTNYSMLEYLLLRPDDSPLFDNGNARWWSFIVLDEAHQYRGAKGIEIAMLLRRLKQRLISGGRNGPFTCIATSATLANGTKEAPAAAAFAQNLFGEPFFGENIIFGETIPVLEEGLRSFSLDDYQKLINLMSSQNYSNSQSDFLNWFNLSIPALTNSVEELIGIALLTDKRSNELRRAITTLPQEANALSKQIFINLPEAQQLPALNLLVQLLSKAKWPGTKEFIISLRFHFFLRALEGTFVTYFPKKGVFLDRKQVEGGKPCFEIALCRECGQHYFLGPKNFEPGMVLSEPVRDPGLSSFGVTYLRPLDGTYSEPEEDDDEVQEKHQALFLCTECGLLGNPEPNCGHPKKFRLPVILESSVEKDDRSDQIKKCGACGYSASGRDPVREVVHGADGPHAVISTALFQNLPADRRKILAFADSRQEAAFFAWYLDDSYKALLRRNLLYKVFERLGGDGEKLSLKDLATGLRSFLGEGKYCSAVASDLENEIDAWTRVYQEFLTDERRISLEGVGLITWEISLPPWFKIPELFLKPPLSFSLEESVQLISLLLDFIRTRKAIELKTPPKISLNPEDLGLKGRLTGFCLGKPGNTSRGKKYAVRSWDGPRSNHVNFLKKILKQKGIPEKDQLPLALESLRAIWEAISEANKIARNNDEKILLARNDERVLNPFWYRVRKVTPAELFVCTICGRLQINSMLGVCKHALCKGELKAAARENISKNHYRILYESELPGSLRVEEHSAQLTSNVAREFQRDFKDGKIHVLSCSTTFELGVDLGNLDTVLLRNVPPESFNYVQRVGRSGRRRGFPGLALTFCKRGSHDLYHFSDPLRIIYGKVHAPSLKITNDKIAIRHMTAVCLSEFFREFPHLFKSVEHFIGSFEQPQGVIKFRKWLAEKAIFLVSNLKNIIPSELVERVGLTNGNWRDLISGTLSKLAEAENEIVSDLKILSDLEKKSIEEKDYKIADWAKYRRKTILEEQVLVFLSRKTIIPKYGFPVDVVELDTQAIKGKFGGNPVSLTRDLTLAIAEFAPTNKIVANKKLWTSFGLKKVAEREWRRQFYKSCLKHSVFIQWEKGEPEPELPCGDHSPSFEYIIPQYGFLASRNGPEELISKPQKVFSTRPFFVENPEIEPEIIKFPSTNPVLLLKKATRGKLVVLCEGRRREGFYICESCGAGFKKPEKKHLNHFGKSCWGKLGQVSLGHEFITDVVQFEFNRKIPGVSNLQGFAYSLASVLIEATAEVLEIPSNDINSVVVYSSTSQVSPIVLYDNVPGGAGLVARLEEENVLRECLEIARTRVSGACGCDENSSCYGCLRSYRNQFIHENLKRGPVRDYLTMILDGWK